MTLSQCQQEIDERSYLLGSVLTHALDTYKIQINSLTPFSENEGYYYIQCNYYKELSSGKFAGDML